MKGESGEGGRWKKEGRKQEVGEKKGNYLVIHSCIFSQEEQRKQLTEEMQEAKMKVNS